MSTVEEVLKLADVKQCLKDTGGISTTGHCHNACTWLILKIKKAGISDYTINLCNGTFWGKDHSWLVVEEDEKYIVIDMTVDQFVDRAVPYSGVLTDEYQIHNSINLCMGIDELVDFIQNLG